MGFADKILTWSAERSASKTIIDDARSRLARQQQLDRTRMVREERTEEGELLLWFTVTVAMPSTFGMVPIPWQGTSEEDARASFIEWLAQDEFQTVDYVRDGQKIRLSFRGSWVSGFTMDGKGRSRPQ